MTPNAEQGQGHAAEIPTSIPTWLVYAVLAMSGLGGLSGVSVLGYEIAVPGASDASVSIEVQALAKDVDRLREIVTTLNQALNAHVGADAARDEAVRMHGRRIDTIDSEQLESERLLRRLEVNQLVICQALEAPCSK